MMAKMSELTTTPTGRQAGGEQFDQRLQRSISLARVVPTLAMQWSDYGLAEQIPEPTHRRGLVDDLKGGSAATREWRCDVL